MPVLTRVRRRLPDVTRLLLGELLGVKGLDAVESRRGVRARVRALELSSRPDIERPRPCKRANSYGFGDLASMRPPARAWPPARQSSTPQSSCVS